MLPAKAVSGYRDGDYRSWLSERVSLSGPAVMATIGAITIVPWVTTCTTQMPLFDTLLSSNIITSEETFCAPKQS